MNNRQHCPKNNLDWLIVCLDSIGVMRCSLSEIHIIDVGWHVIGWTWALFIYRPMWSCSRYLLIPYLSFCLLVSEKDISQSPGSPSRISNCKSQENPVVDSQLRLLFRSYFFDLCEHIYSMNMFY